MKYARIEQNVVRETIELPEGLAPSGIFANDQDWVQCPDGATEGWVVYGGQVVSPDNLALVHDRVDQAAGRARARYITVAPGQEITYLLKGQQAEAYKAAGYTGQVPPMIEAEANAVGCSPQEAADDILAQQALWVVKAAQIEASRRSWKLSIATSNSRLDDVVEAEAELDLL